MRRVSGVLCDVVGVLSAYFMFPEWQLTARLDSPFDAYDNGTDSNHVRTYDGEKMFQNR